MFIAEEGFENIQDKTSYLVGKIKAAVKLIDTSLA
jgi:hypothetical protein